MSDGGSMGGAVRRGPSLTRRRLVLMAAAAALTACRPGDSPAPGATAPAAPATTTPVAAPPEPEATPTAASETPTAAPPPPEPTAAAPDAVEGRLPAMSLEEKVGQLFMVHFSGPEVSPFLREMIERRHVGGIVLFAISGNIESIAQVATLVNGAQALATGDGGAPLLVALDQEGGLVVRIREGATVFPGNMSVGATGSAEMARRMAAVTAAELRALGINCNLAPVLDVNNNPDNPVIGLRSFGSSPEMVAEMGTAMIGAYHEAGVVATAKHFPGHGDTGIDSHVGLPVVPHDRAHLEAVELLPFRAAIAAGVGAIMTAHVELPAIDPTEGLPATLSAEVLQGLLRRDMGFEGVIVSDSLGMGALTTQYGVAEAAALAFQAGCDMLAFGADPGQGDEQQRQAYDALLSLFTSGAVPESRLDQSVRRILALKARHGLLQWQPADVAGLAGAVGTEEHLAVAREIAQAAVTLVRDEAALLPLAAEAPLLVVTPQGLGDLAAALRPYHADVRQVAYTLDPTDDEIAEAARQAEGAGAVVVATANSRRYTKQGALVAALLGRPVAVVALRNPYDLMVFPQAPCYLAAYGDTPVSLDAAARVLLGQAAPAGRLPVELPGLYPLGHGLLSFAR